MKKWIVLLLCAAMMLTLITGCGTTNGETDPGVDEGNARDTVTVGIGKFINDMNPMNMISGEQRQLFHALFSTLVTIEVDENEKFVLSGDLAERWENTNDGKTWVFDLNPDAVFSNGEPVTAEDVKFSFEETARSAYTKEFVNMVTEVEVIDEHTVAVHMDDYNVRAPYCWEEVYIVNSKLYQEDLDSYLKTLVGSGPYTLGSVDAATGNITLLRNEGYWGELPAMKQVDVRVIEDNDTLLIALQTGQVDVGMIGATKVDQALESGKVTVIQHPTDYTQQIIFNTQAAPFDNKLVRQAISHAINWELLAEVRTDGHYKTLTTLLYVPALDIEPTGIKQYEYDPERAKELLAEAGITTPYDLGEFYGGSGGAAELIQQNLADVGLLINPVTQESYTFVSALMDGNFGLAYMGGNGGYATAAEQLTQWYVTGSVMNMAHYSNPEIDDIAAQLIKEQDQAKRDELILKALEIIAEDAPYANTSIDYYFTAQNEDLNVPLARNSIFKFSALSWK